MTTRQLEKLERQGKEKIEKRDGEREREQEKTREKG